MAVRRVTQPIHDSPEAVRLRHLLTLFETAKGKSSDPLLKRKIKIDRRLRKLRDATQDGSVQILE